MPKSDSKTTEAAPAKASKKDPVGKYEERPLKDALANPKDIKAAENLPEKDQIEDYHKKHPTLKQSQVEAE